MNNELLITSENIDELYYLRDNPDFSDIKYLICDDNKLTYLPVFLPPGLAVLSCHNNKLTSLPDLPRKLNVLDCDNNELTSLPDLPIRLKKLDCTNNKLTSLPKLPNTLAVLDCRNNELTSLPDIPLELEVLSCGNNKLTSLPNLRNVDAAIECENNNLTSLPRLPEGLPKLYCVGNPLRTLVNIPDNLYYLDLDVDNLNTSSLQIVFDFLEHNRGDEDFVSMHAELMQRVDAERIKRDIRNVKAATGIGGLFPEEHKMLIGDRRSTKMMYKYDPLTPGFAKSMSEVDKYLNKVDAGQRVLATGTEGLTKENHSRYIENTRATGKKTKKDQSDGAFSYVNTLVGEYLGKPIERGGRKSKKSRKSKKKKSRKNKK